MTKRRTAHPCSGSYLYRVRTARPEFTAKLVRRWLGRVGVETLFIEPGSPWENGYNESFNGKLRGRAVERGDLLLVGAGGRAGRAMGARVQYRPTPQRLRRLSPGP